VKLAAERAEIPELFGVLQKRILCELGELCG
jgi:hypothetical protein